MTLSPPLNALAGQCPANALANRWNALFRTSNKKNEELVVTPASNVIGCPKRAFQCPSDYTQERRGSFWTEAGTEMGQVFYAQQQNSKGQVGLLSRKKSPLQVRLQHRSIANARDGINAVGELTDGLSTI